MSVIITDTGFAADTFSGDFASGAPDATSDSATALDLRSDADPREYVGKLKDVRMVRIDFPSFADGRGFSIARALRRSGYEGRLRARGHVLADQYAMARRSGFDEVEIDDLLAARQPEDQWLARANWSALDYRTRLAG